MFNVNGIEWDVMEVSRTSDKLMRSDGTYTLGMTDNNTKTVYISNDLTGKLRQKVLCHELVHVASFSYDCDIALETEEIIADFMSLYGAEIIKNVDFIVKKLLKTEK